jgi:cobalt-zinc-cadmium efflux system outer membrane protein
MVLACVLLGSASCAGSPTPVDLPAPVDTRARAGQSAPTPQAEALPPRLTIDEALREAEHRNLSLMAQRLNLSLADASMVAARVRPNPVLSLDVDHVNVVKLSNGDLTEAAARVDVPIVLGGKRDYRIEVADQDHRIAVVQLEDALRKLRLDVSTACIDVIQAKANLALAQDNLKTFVDLVQLNDRRVLAGAIAAMEGTRSKVAMLQYRSGVKRSELELAGARTKLKVLLGRTGRDGDLEVAEDLQIRPSEVNADAEQLTLQAFSTRPDLRALELAQARSESDLKLQVANGIVDLTAGAEYRWSAAQPSERLFGFFLSVPIPFYNSNAGEIARAETQRLVAARQREALKGEVTGDVRSAADEFNAARDLVRSIEGELLRSALEVRDAENRRYQSGATSFLDFIDAQRAYNDVRQSLNDAWASYRRSVVRLNAGVGSEVIR